MGGRALLVTLRMSCSMQSFHDKVPLAHDITLHVGPLSVHAVPKIIAESKAW